MLAISLGASACGGDSSDSSDSEGAFFDETEEAVEQNDASRGGDAEAEIVTDAGGVDEDAADAAVAGADDEEAMEDDSEESEDSDEGESASEAPADGGFFEEPDRDQEEDNTFEDYGVRSFIDTADDPLSTFALDVDTASYSIARQWLGQGSLPPQDSVRVEEFVNSFDYDYPAPNDGLTIVAEGGPSPFDPDNIIVAVGVQAEVVSDADRPAASLVFVIDTSGSMGQDNRLELVKTSLIGLVQELDRDDTVAIVTYSDGADVLLEPTSARNDDEIIEAIEELQPNGSTNLEAGLEAGYDLANDAFQRNGINRVILASDGVANVGLTDPDGLVNMIRDDADEGIQLVTVGVGMGNFNDVVMETLADDGDGFYAYVDTEEEADKLFNEDLVSTLLTVAIDGKIQVDFDPDVVESYRLLGFENRAVLDDDFRNDDVDAGELGAGHQVTAIYELKLVDDPRGNRLGTASLRWEDPETRDVRETRLELATSIVEDRWSNTSDDFRLAVTVAAFAEILRGSPFADDVSLDQVAEEAEAIAGRDDEVRQLVDLIRDADRLS